MKQLITLWLVVTALWAGPVAAQEPGPEVHQAITKASEDNTPSFVLAGKVSEVLVKRGDRVKAGQVLLKLDDEVEKIRVAKLKALAENKTRVEAAAAQLAQKEVDLKRLEDLGRQNVATKWEIEQARLEKLIGELSLELAKFEHEQAKIDYEEARKTLDRMRLESPIDGVVERVEVDTGEAVDRLQPVIQILQNDPMHIDVPVPSETAAALQLDQPASVRFDDGTTLTGKVVFKSSKLDEASQTRAIRVEVGNPNQRPVGEQVRVTFGPAPAGETSNNATSDTESGQATPQTQEVKPASQEGELSHGRGSQHL